MTGISHKISESSEILVLGLENDVAFPQPL